MITRFKNRCVLKIYVILLRSIFDSTYKGKNRAKYSCDLYITNWFYYNKVGIVRRGHLGLDHVSNGTSYFYLYFIFGFGKESISSFLQFFLRLSVQGTIIFFLIFLFELRARSALYHLEGFYSTTFCSPYLEQPLYKINNYVILKHISQS